MDISAFGGFDAREFEGVEGGDAAIKKEKIGLVSFGMTRIDAFVLAIQNPPSVEHGRHARHLGREAEVVAHGLAVVQRYSSERPDFRAACGAVNSVPAVHKNPTSALVGGGKGPG